MNVFSQIFNVNEHKCLEYKLNGPRKISPVLIIKVKEVDLQQLHFRAGRENDLAQPMNGQNHFSRKEAGLSTPLFPEKRGWSDSPPKTPLHSWAKLPCTQSVCHREWIAKKNASCLLNLDMSRGWDSVGRLAEMRFNRNSCQCEHFLRCLSVTVNAMLPRTMQRICRQEGCTSLQPWLLWVVPFQMQNERSTINTI